MILMAQDNYFTACDKNCSDHVNLRMLNEDEQRFVEYWSANRLKQKSFFKQLAVGMPVGVLFAFLIFINFISGWDKKASMMFNTYSSARSLIIVLLIAIILIVIFVSVFSVKVKWERNEQLYRELLAKKERDNVNSGT
jgi:protein-S-isoprenylcysteine O-methyltransferase Ste14